MRAMCGTTTLLILALIMAACSAEPAEEDVTITPGPSEETGGAPADAKPDRGPGADRAKGDLPDRPNQIVEGMASGKIQGSWKAQPTAEQRKGFAGHEADPENAPEGKVVPPSPDAMASSTMTFTPQEITVGMGDEEMVDRYVILEDTETALVYQVFLGAGAEGADPSGAEGSRLKATFETDDQILIQPDGEVGFDITFIRTS